MAKTNPMYKDTVFRMLFKEPKEALNLYNALNGTKYDDPEKSIWPHEKTIPVPRFVVFYNGVEAQAEKFSYRLSYRKR